MFLIYDTANFYGKASQKSHEIIKSVIDSPDIKNLTNRIRSFRHKTDIADLENIIEKVITSY